MPFEKGHNLASKSRRRLSDAMRRELAQQASKGPDVASRIARRLINMAEAGDLGAIRELADRTEGKPVQALHLGQDDDSSPVTINIVSK